MPRSDEGRRVVFLDEFPWFATKQSDFLIAFADFWNSWASKQDDLVVIICESATASRRMLLSGGRLLSLPSQNLVGGVANYQVASAFVESPILLHPRSEFAAGSDDARHAHVLANK